MVGVAVFTTVRPGVWVAVTVAVDGLEVTAVWFEPVAEAVAELTMVPASRSAVVVVYVPAQVVLAPGSREVLGQLMDGTGPAGAVKVSLILNPLTARLPLLVTRKL